MCDCPDSESGFTVACFCWRYKYSSCNFARAHGVSVSVWVCRLFSHPIYSERQTAPFGQRGRLSGGNTRSRTREITHGKIFFIFFVPHRNTGFLRFPSML